MEVLLTKEYITGLLEQKGISKVEFASRMGVVRQNLDAMLESKKKDINTVIKMAEVLNIPFTEFIGMEKGSNVTGFLKINGEIVEIACKEDLEKVLEKI